MNKNKILKFNDVMEVLGIGRNSTLNLFHREDFPSFFLARKHMIHEDKFNEWLKKQGETS